VSADYALPYYLVSRSIKNIEDVRRIGLALTMVALLVSIVLLFEAYSFWPLYRGAYHHYGMEGDLGIGVKVRAGLMRTGGPFLESTSMAFALALCFFAALSMRHFFRSVSHHAAVICTLIVGLLAPQSRGAWIAVALGLIMIEVYRGRYSVIATRMTLIGGVVIGLIVAASGSQRLSELAGISGDALGTVSYRSLLFERGTQEFWKSPVFGQPPAQVYRNLSDLRQGEGLVDFVNTYLYVALVSGSVGLLIFIIGMLLPVVSLLNRRSYFRRADVDLRLPAFVFAGIVVPIEMLAFTSFSGRPAILYFMFLAMAAGMVRLRPRAPFAVLDRSGAASGRADTDRQRRVSA
jgi:hypothetical protein